MNILFVTNKNVDPLIGGIERITYSLAREFRRQGKLCYNLFTQENMRGTSTDDVFEGKCLLAVEGQIEQVAERIETWQIDVIMAQGSDASVNVLMPMLRQAVNRAGRGKIVFVFHNMPGFELVNRPWYWRMMMPILRRLLRNKYATPYNNADKVVMLAEGFIKPYAQLAQTAEDKYTYIWNALSFEDADCLPVAKEKEVLIVTRLVERHKRVSHALKAWQIVEKDAPDWRLTIVGYGEDEAYYKQLTQQLGLRNVHFEGLQNPLPYYQRASIFLMSSAFEGWGLTVMEAEQNKCVPIATDSYAAVHDMIVNGEDGFIVPDHDVSAYAEKILTLIQDEQMLERMGRAARENTKRFTAEKIAEKWNQLFEQV